MDEGNGLIFVGIPRERTYIPQFVDNRDRILTALGKAGRYCGTMQVEGHRVDLNRDELVKTFLRHDRQPEWLLMLDSDMEYPDACALRLAQWDEPVIGALYFYRNQQFQPQAFRFTGAKTDEYGRETYAWASMRKEVYEYLEAKGMGDTDGALCVDGSTDALLEVDAAGAGCMLIHRSVLAQMRPPWFEYPHGWSSEDLEFCKRVKEEQGVAIHVDMSTICGHYRYVPVSVAHFMWAYREDRKPVGR